MMDDQSRYLCMTALVLVLFFMLFRANDSVKEGFQETGNIDRKGYGMWCTNQNCLNATFMPQGMNRIYVGDFAADADGIPKKAGGTSILMDGSDLKNIKSSAGGTPIVYVTIAGEGAKAAAKEDLVKLYNGGFKFDGLDFDMEGELGRDRGGARELMEQCMETVKYVSENTDRKSLYVQFTVLGGDDPEGPNRWATPYKEIREQYEGSTFVKKFNISLMLYGASMSDIGWGCTGRDEGPTFKFINNWLQNKDISPYKGEIILGMTPMGMEGKDKGPCFLNSFRDIVSKNGLYGINFWQPSGAPCSVCQMMTDETTFPGLKEIFAVPVGPLPALTCKKNPCGPVPPPPSSSPYRCGKSWADANTNCNPTCQTRDQCTASGFTDCYSGVADICPHGGSLGSAAPPDNTNGLPPPAETKSLVMPVDGFSMKLFFHDANY